MSFVNWMNMNMLIDIACVVFMCAAVWKFRVLSKKIDEKETKICNLEEKGNLIKSDLESTRSDLNITMKNPQAARRLLKERL